MDGGEEAFGDLIVDLVGVFGGLDVVVFWGVQKELLLGDYVLD